MSNYVIDLYASMKITKPWNRGEKVSSARIVKPKFGVKRMIDSYTEILLPFKTDSHLVEQYENYFGVLR
jgi:acyl-coenzyme A thioesterase 9